MSDEGNSDLDCLSDNDSLSDDDLELILNATQVKNENYIDEVVQYYSNKTFFEHFRFHRDIVNNISEQFKQSNYYSKKCGQYGNIPPLHQVLIYLWYIGHQTASFRDVGDRFDITTSSVNRIIYRLTMFLSNLSPQLIKWPTEAEKRISAQHFRTNGFPAIIGAIDGCHVKIDKPEIDPESYINRKGYYSIQMQVVCDHSRRIIDLFLGYPGSVHDSRVFRNSSLKRNLQQKCGSYFLLGDSGYPLQSHLLTPYKDRGNLTRCQRNYNIQLAKNRYIIEHTFGVLKQKFRQLYHVKLRNVRFITHFIRAACVLHNIGIEDDFQLEDLIPPMNPDVEAPNQEVEDNEDENANDGGEALIRDRVANSLMNL